MPPGPGSRRDAQRPRAVGAPGRRPAPRAGQRRDVAPRAAPAPARARPRPGPCGRSRGPSRAAAPSGRRRRARARSRRPAACTRGAALRSTARSPIELVRPAGLDQQGGLGGAGACPRRRRRSCPARPAGRGRPGRADTARARRVQVVAVVPDHHQPEVADRGEHRRPRAQHDLGGAPRRGEELPVALLRGVVGAQHREGVLGQQPRRRGGEPVEVLAVGDDDERAPPSGQRGPAQLDQPGGPVLARQRRPDRPAPAAPRPAPSAGPARPVAREPGRVGRAGQRRRGSGVGRFSAPPRRGGSASRRTSPSVPAYRSATTRASRATCGVSTGSPDGTCDSGRSLPAKSVGLRELPHEAVDQPTVEPHPDPAAGLHGVGELLRAPRSRTGRSRCASGTSTTTRATSGVRGGPAGRRVGEDAGCQCGQAPTAARRASTRSSRSQGSSTSVRPKWP